jgi:hypothetical protein
MFRPESAQSPALEPPGKAHGAIARAIEQIARRPAELVGKLAPLVEEPARIVDGLTPILFRHTGRALALKLSPCGKVALRHTVHGLHQSYGSYAPIYLTRERIEFARRECLP